MLFVLPLEATLSEASFLSQRSLQKYSFVILEVMCPHALRFGQGSRANPAPLSGKSGNTCLARAVLWPRAASHSRHWGEGAVCADPTPHPIPSLPTGKLLPLTDSQ